MFPGIYKEKGIFETHSMQEYPNVIIVKAFTKLYAIPGVRLGFLFCGSQNKTGQIFNQLPEWNISTIAEAAGLAALDETEYCNKNHSIHWERACISNGGTGKAGNQSLPWEADFLLIKTDDPLYEKLLKKKILIRDCSNYRGLSKGYYRIAVKTHKENEKLIAQLKDTIMDKYESSSEIKFKINKLKNTSVRSLEAGAR